jgi:predicted glycoside hydrolase/deacetylase ChbG (UPF0249 family)
LHSPVRTVDLEGLMGHDISDLRVLVDERGPVELCCHPELPAAAAEGTLAGKPSSHRRSEELEYLLSPRFRELLERAQARPVSYWEVG